MRPSPLERAKGALLACALGLSGAVWLVEWWSR